MVDVYSSDLAYDIGHTTEAEDILRVMEVADVQLMELGVYDRSMDTALESAYRDVKGNWITGPCLIHCDLREVRVDMVRPNNASRNTTRFLVNGIWDVCINCFPVVFTCPIGTTSQNRNCKPWGNYINSCNKIGSIC